MTRWRPAAITIDPAKRAAARRTADALGQVLSGNPTLGDRTPSLVEDIRRSRALLLSAGEWADKLDHEGVQVAFIAPKGAGKSSVLNGLLRTWASPIDRPDLGEGPSEYLQRLSVLPLGAGGTTPCEVRFEYAETWKVSVDGEEDGRFRSQVDALAGSALRSALMKVLGLNSGGDADGEADADESFPVNSDAATVLRASPLLTLPCLEGDVRRCLIGVCGLRAGAVSGEATLEQLAQAAVAPWKLQFSGQLSSVAAVSALGLRAERLRDQLLTGAAPAKRNSFDAHLPSGAPPMVWLKAVLQHLTWGRCPGQPFPARIDIQGPTFPRLQGSAQRLRMIDTLGLRAVEKDNDGPPLMGRRDLDSVLSSLWTVAVYVAGFMNPPDPVTPALRAALTGDTQLTPHHRTIVPLLYKGEAMLLDPRSSDNRQDERAQEAKNKRSACTDAINALLRQGGGREAWSDTFSPVIDLTGSLGGVGAMSGLESAIEARLRSMGLAFERAVDKMLSEADHLITRAQHVEQLTARIISHSEQHVGPQRNRVLEQLGSLKANPVLPFADACDSQARGGYLHWKTIESIAYGRGRGSENAFEVTRNDVVSGHMGYVGSSLAAWRNAVDSARERFLSQSEDDLAMELVEFAHRSQMAEVEALESVIGAAFAAAFEAVADRLSGGPHCLWGNKQGLISVLNRGKRPLGPAFTAAIEAWGQRHQAELWGHVLSYLKARGVELPQV
jgi:hypothetical protein